MRIALLTCLIALAGAASAQDRPPPAYFVGQFQVIGRDATGPVEDVLRMAEDGAGLTLQSCLKGQGTMAFDPLGEGPFARVTLGDWLLDCQYFNDWDNYPLLACTDDAGAKITLWPDPAGAGAAAMACPP